MSDLPDMDMVTHVHSNAEGLLFLEQSVFTEGGKDMFAVSETLIKSNHPEFAPALSLAEMFLAEYGEGGRKAIRTPS